MLTLAICTCSSEAAERKPAHFEAHAAHLRGLGSRLKMGGVLDIEDRRYDPAEDQSPASLMIFDESEGFAASRNALIHDPYYVGGIWSRIDLFEVAAFHGVWSPGHDAARREALAQYPGQTVMPLPERPRNYAMLAWFEEGFSPTPELVRGHKELGVRMSDRLRAAMPIRHVDTLGVSATERSWQLCCIIAADTIENADAMTAEDPLVTAGLMHHRTFAIPAALGDWARQR